MMLYIPVRTYWGGGCWSRLSTICDFNAWIAFLACGISCVCTLILPPRRWNISISYVIHVDIQSYTYTQTLTYI